MRHGCFLPLRAESVLPTLVSFRPPAPISAWNR